MQYFVPAFVALAISANAAPHWNYPSGFPGAAPPAPAHGGSGLIPTGTGLAFPTSTGYSKGLTLGRAAADDDEEEEEEEESSSSDADEEEEDEEEEESESSDADEEEESSESESSGESSSSDDEEEESSSETEAATPTSTSGSGSSSGNSSAPAVTTAPSSGSGSGSSSGGSLPASSGTSVLSAVQTIAAGESFDGGMVAYDRGVDCSGQSEGGDSDAVFYLENGASLSNVIIGPNQVEGVHCFGSCTLTNVWWSAVCEDAFTIKEQEASETTTISGGGAFGAEDKVLQHNGGGTLSVSGFTVETFGKLYRSCGNCDSMPQRHVIFDDISATDGKSLAGINSNYGDTATFTNVVATGVSDICVEYEGNDTGDEPTEISSGPSEYCIYSETDVTSS